MIVTLVCALFGLAVMAWVICPWWSRPVLAAGIAAILIAGAAGGYYAMGSWRTQQAVVEAAANPQVAQAQMIQGMVDRLAARLKESPDDAEGWKKLGRSYSVLGRYAESAEAYAKSNALSKDSDVEALLGEAESLALANERRLDGKPTELLTRALKLSPDDPRGLWFAGLAAAQSQDTKTAALHWRRLLKQELPDTIRADLEVRLQEIEKLNPSPKK